MRPLIPLLEELHAEGTTIGLVAHDEALAARMRDGSILDA
jgi:ABC-type ATPase involved in cell division